MHFQISVCPSLKDKDESGKPVLGSPILDDNDLPTHGYDKNGIPLYDCFDSNGKPKNGADPKGNPIKEFDSNG